MSKSTPINQLPNPNIKAFAEPPATLPPIGDPSAEDDATIQEVLNQINGGGSGTGGFSNSEHAMPRRESHGDSALNGLSYADLQQQLAFYNQQMQPLAQAQAVAVGGGAMPATAPPVGGGIASSLDQFLRLFAEDIKLAGLVFAVVLIVRFVPVVSVLSRYIAVHKIPYHELIVQALLAALLVVTIRHFVLGK